MNEKQQSPDRREYTLMIVPHNGQTVHSIKIPIRAIKAATVVMCVILTLVAGFGFKYSSAIQSATAEKAELEALRQNNGIQYERIEQLTQKTATLQQDMDKLNKLEAEIRRLVNTEEQPSTSRAGIVRQSGLYYGQGGPNISPSLNELDGVIDLLSQQAKVREQSLNNLREILQDRNAKLNSTPSIWPTNGEVTSRFGWRGSPWGRGSDWHPGIDIANSTGTPIVATAAGEVVYSGWYSGYGNMVQIDHGDGVITVYGHNSENVVQVGQVVKKGQIIAYMGSTGYSTGPHVHYEVRVNGTVVNPANFL